MIKNIFVNSGDIILISGMSPEFTRIARGAERPPEGQVFWRSERNTPPNFVTLQRCSETMGIALSLPVMQLLPVLT